MKFRNRSIRFGLLLTATSLAAVASYAAAPPAGSKIGNQASATYTNAAGDTISVTSNRVETIVQQVAGLTLVTDNTENVAPGGKVFLPHVLTNDGNGTDTYNLTATEPAAPGAFDFLNVTIFPDADFDGVADSTVPITVTPALSAGESFGFVIEATVPGGAPLGTSETIDVVATSQFSTTTPTTLIVSNLDTVTVSNDAITEITKKMTVVEGPGAAADGVTGPGDIVTIELTYSSTGLAAANDLVVTDQLNQYLSYVANSGRWSDSANALTDSEDPAGSAGAGSPLGYEQENGTGFQIAYEYDGTDTVEFQIDSVPASRSGTVTFQATITADAPAGEIPNTATQTVNAQPAPPSNTAKIIVDPVYAVTAADAPSTGSSGPDGTDPTVAATDGANLVASNTVGGVTTAASSTDDDAALNDVVEEDGTDGTNDIVFQGDSVTFEFVVTNNANVADTVNLSFANDATNGFPAGTTFQLVGSDGSTPIVGPLGPLDPGASALVNIIATFSSDVATQTAGNTNYEVNLTAQSTNGGLPNSTTGLYTGAILGATVDLTNTGLPNGNANSGFGPGPDDGSTLISTPTNPGQPVSFPLTVTNNGPTSDTYNLSLPNPLPPGWTAVFTLPDGTPITNTGVIPGGGAQNIIVIITPPAGEAPGLTPVQVKIESPTSGQGDTLTNRVEVNEIVDVSLTSDQSVQVAPGGVVDIPHILANEGNVNLTEGALSANGEFSTFSGTIFWDVDRDGIVDAGDVVVDNINDITNGIAVGTNGILAGENIQLIHRVQVPSNGAIGLSEAETLNAATLLNGGTSTDGDTTDNTVVDTVRIVSGDLTLVKKQAIDAACDGGTVAADFGTADVSAKPGECIRYQITASNTGTDDAGSVTIADTVPGFTTLFDCAGACKITVTPSATSTVTPDPDAAGSYGGSATLESVHGTLIPGAPATLEFTVKIDE